MGRTKGDTCGERGEVAVVGWRWRAGLGGAVAGSRAVVHPGVVEGLAHAHGGLGALVVEVGAGALQGSLDREAIDLEGGGELSRHQVEGGLLAGLGVVGDLDQDVAGLADAVEAAVGLADGAGVEVDALDPDGAEEVDEVVEAGLDGAGMGDEEAAAGPDDGVVEPALAVGGADLGDVEEDRRLAEVAEEELLVAAGEAGPAGVAKEEEDVAAVAEVVGEALDDPALLGGEPGGGEGAGLGDGVAAGLGGVAEDEGGQVVGGAVADDLGLGVARGLDEDLAVAEAADEGLFLAAAEVAAEAAGEGPEVGEEGAGVAAHDRAGEGDDRHARELDEAVGGLLLGGADAGVFVHLVEDEEVEAAAVALEDGARQGVAPGLGDGLVEGLAAGGGLGPFAGLTQGGEGGRGV